VNHRKYLKGLLLITFISGFVVSNAYASEVLELTLKNGGSMPISPGVVYAIHGEASESMSDGKSFFKTYRASGK
jgi:hypothetical protein